MTPELSVHGIKNLKLADLGVVPENVGANTGNTAFVVGEKAASIFIKELGLDGAQGKAEGGEQSKRADSPMGQESQDVVVGQ